MVTRRHALYGEVRDRFKALRVFGRKSCSSRDVGSSPYLSRMSVRSEHAGKVARATLGTPARRNALDEASLGALADALARVRDGDADVLVLAGEGSAFCAGFDLARCAEDPRAVEPLLLGLSACVRALRELDIPVVARVQGAALAGGCALLTGCDFVVVAEDAQLGYPTHRIGISPAVSIPTLVSRMGPAARALLVANDLVDGRSALRLGLATHCSASPDSLEAETDRLVASLLSKGPQALRATKAWLNELDGSIDEARHLHAEMASAAAADGDEFASMLRAFWATRRAPVTPR